MQEKDDFVFRGQRPDEEVILAVRQHPWVLARPGFIILLCIFVMIAAVAYFGASGITSWVMFVMICFIIFYGFYKWYLWWNGNVVLTDQRIIQSLQIGLFSRKILEADLSKIQDAVCEINGLANSLLNIGAIQLQTASKEKILKIDFIFNPYDIQQKIMHAQKKLSEKF